MSPSQAPQTSLEIHPKDRRHHPRFESCFHVELLNTGEDPRHTAWEASVPATGLDVSRTGMRLQADYNVPVGTKLSVIIYYKQLGSLCLGQVMWRKQLDGATAIYGLYIETWTSLDPHLAHQLAKMEQDGILCRAQNKIP